MTREAKSYVVIRVAFVFIAVEVMLPFQCKITTRILDALVLAIETGAPIYVEKYIVEQFFQNLVANPNEILINKMPIQDMSLAELNEELRIAVEDEAYEEAAKIRDEINRRREAGTTGEATNIPPDFPF